MMQANNISEDIWERTLSLYSQLTERGAQYSQGEFDAVARQIHINIIKIRNLEGRR